ncbi:MAG: endonuclease III [Bacteroidales bacterium]|nr:endonuclease III [Bacteroidales bacterium]MDY2917202.1 endonuclease III [Muribaculaceae bacterium]
MKIADRYKEALRRFEEEMPMPETELHYADPFQLLVAVILSAQCTDKRVNMVTPELFRAFPTPQKLAEAEPQELYEYIKSISYPNNKTKALIGMAKALVERFDGQVPEDIDDLLTLPGVGRKTANVMLAVVFNKPAMAVDTHVFRVSNRLGLTNNSRTPLATEKTLMKHIPAEAIPKAHHWLILHGRYVCTARKPDCEGCYLADICKKRAADLRAAAKDTPPAAKKPAAKA